MNERNATQAVLSLEIPSAGPVYRRVATSVLPIDPSGAQL